jgi:GT2 family glycosyltransferase
VTTAAARTPVGPSDFHRSVAVVICTHDSRRWSLLRQAIDSVRGQRYPVEQCIVVVDHNDELLRRLQAEFPNVLLARNRGRRGLAGARNTALAHARADIVAFLDDDGVAEAGWLEELIPFYGDARVVGVGGSVVPVWSVRRPRWFPDEFDWVVGCSWTGLPRRVAPVRNLIGAGMSFRRCAFELAGVFTEGIGRGSADAMGCEETEFAIRLRQREPTSTVLYVPDAAVRHYIDPRRATWAYFVTRCRSEGRSKALVASAVGAHDALASERTYITRVLPQGVRSGLRDALHGDVTGILRAGAIVVGLALTTAGYVDGRLRTRAQSHSRSVRPHDRIEQRVDAT